MGFNSFKAMWEMTDHLKATTTEMSVLYALAYIMNDKTFACHPSQRLIAKNIGAIITMRLKELPVKVVNNPSGATPATGQQPSTGGAGAVHGGGQTPPIR